MIDVETLIDAYEVSKKDIEEIEKLKETLLSQANNIRQELTNYLVENKLYIPISEISKYSNKCIENITLVSSLGEVQDFLLADDINIDDGELFIEGCCGYEVDNSTLLMYEESKGKYWCNLTFLNKFTEEYTDIVGFFDVQIGKHDLTHPAKYLPETTLTHLIKESVKK